MDIELNDIEACPLQQQQHNYTKKPKPPALKVPLRVVRLCILGIGVPTLLVALPLYFRYNVYGSQVYPFAVSDMRLLNNRISTIWCQRQLVQMNATFNAFLMPDIPSVAPLKKPVEMTRELLLEDDTKEYWGFYLLRGSAITISTCVRWPGASLIVIRGHKNLHDCAYIGDDSSEEMDELLELLQGQGLNDSSSSSSISNDPALMKRFRSDVKFHHPSHDHNKENSTLRGEIDAIDIIDPKIIRQLLTELALKANKKKQKNNDLNNNNNKEHHPHVHRTSNFGKNEKSNFNFDYKPTIRNEEKVMTSSEELFKELEKKLEAFGDHERVMKRLNERFMGGSIVSRGGGGSQDNSALAATLNRNDEDRNSALEEGFIPDGIADHRSVINQTNPNDMSNSEFWSSFSSSEEALLNCAGLILNLPLTPHSTCQKQFSNEQLSEAFLTNTITYQVPSNGYYFFVFNSENEVQKNYIRVHFLLNKTMYDVSNPISICSHTNSSCSMNLKFYSNQHVVMELPIMKNETRWNDEFIAISECEPRTMVYTICILLVPIFILFFAFQ